jgi:transposase
MHAPLTSLNRDDMETRRLAAAEELLSGTTQSEVARRYGVSRTTASRWHRSIVRKGFDGLRRRRATGRPSRLNSGQMEAIRQIYFEGAAVHGYATDRWTTGRLAQTIERRFGIRYDPDHVGRLMHKLGLRERQIGRETQLITRPVFIFGLEPERMEPPSAGALAGEPGQHSNNVVMP